MAVATILISSLIAIRKDNLKARLAFSTVGQLSYIILGIAILSPFAATGALYHIVAHAFMKITLFMCAGAIFVTTSPKKHQRDDRNRPTDAGDHDLLHSGFTGSGGIPVLCGIHQ